MASITYDSELMTNYVAALPVPPSTRYVTCLDPVSCRPMVFAIGRDGKLQCLKEDETSQIILIDIGKLMGISSSSWIQTFDCQQANDFSIYLTVAVEVSATRSNILVTQPFQMSVNPTIRVLPIHSMGTVQRLFMGSPDSGLKTSYPIILATHKPEDRLGSSTDIERIMVNDQQSDWYTLRDMQLPVNVERIDDIAPAANAYGRGLYALVNVAGSQQIIGEFARPDLDQDDGSLFWYNVKVECPAGATSIATVTDLRGRSALLVSCIAGLQYLTCWEATNRGMPGRTLNTHALFHMASRLEVAQDREAFTVWAIGDNGQFGYQTMKVASPVPTDLGKPTPLLPAGRATGFSASVSSSFPAINRTVTFQSIITNDTDGNLSLWQQSNDTGIWSKMPFYMANLSTIVAIKSYTINLTARNSSGATVSNGSVYITSSSYLNAIVNGNPTMLHPGGTKLSLDISGQLDFIVPTYSISSQTLKVSNVADSNGVDVGTPARYIDPSLKAIEAFKSIKNGQDLANAKTKKGAELFPSSTRPPQADLDAAASGFAKMYESAQRRLSDGTIPKARPSEPSSSDVDFKMDVTNFAEETASTVGGWVLNTVNGLLELVIQIGNETKKLVLDTIEKIGEGILFVWKKVKLGIDMLIEFVGWLFDLADIIETKNTVQSLINGSLTYAYNKANSINLDAAIDNFFAPLTNIRAPTDVGSDTMNTQRSFDPRSDDIGSSTKVKFIGERLKNGGASTGSTMDDYNNTRFVAGDAIVAALETTIGTLMTTVDQLGQGIVDLLSAGAAEQRAILAKIGQAALGDLIAGAKKICKGIMSAIASIIDFVKIEGNTPIHIPVVSEVYKLFTGGELPSLFEIVSFIIAVPMTIITKLITGSAPPSLRFDGTMFDNHFISGRPTPPSQSQARGLNSNAGQAPPPRASQPSSRSEGVSALKLEAAPSAAPLAVTQGGADAGPSFDEVSKKIGTIVKGITCSSSVLVPIVATVNTLYAGYKAKEDEWASAGAFQDMADAFMPMRAIRGIALFIRLVSVIATFVKGDGDAPAPEWRFTAALMSGMRATVGSIVFFMDPPSSAGKIAHMREQVGANKNTNLPEDFYQVVAAMQGVVNLVSYSFVYEKETAATTWRWYNVPISQLGLTDNCLGFGGNMGNRLAYATIRNSQPPVSTLLAMAVANAMDIASTNLKLAHWVKQFQAGMYPSLTESGGGE